MKTKTKENWAVLYMRPDGWWVAGTDFKNQKEANECAREQLPDHVRWTAVKTESIVISDKSHKDGEGKVITKIPGVLDS